MTSRFARARASRFRSSVHTRGMGERARARLPVRPFAHAFSVYGCCVLVNGRDGAIRCSICINIYLASLRRSALREMEARLPSSPTCLPVPRSRYAGFPRENVPLVLRTGLPFELQTASPPSRTSPYAPLPPPPRLLYPLAYAALPPATLPFGVAGRRRLTSEPGLLAPARSIGRHNKKSKR